MDGVATPPRVAQEEAGHAALSADPAASARWRTAATLGVLLALTAAACVVFWPGLMDMDTVAEYGAAQTNTYDDWHTAILSGVWHVAYAAGLHNPGWALLPTVFVFLVGLYLLFRTRLSRPWALVATALCFAFPPVLAWAVHLGKDTWLTAFAVCGMGLVARAVRTHGRARTLSLAAAALCAVFASATRQNGVPITLAIVVAICLLMLSPRWRGWRRVLLSAGVGVAASLVTLVMLAGVQHYLLHVKSVHPEQALYLYDTAALSRAENKVLIPADVFPSQDLGYLKTWSNRVNINALVFGPTARVRFFLQGPALDSLRQAWISAIRTYPRAYLRERLHMTLDQVDVTAAPFFPYQVPPQPPAMGYSSTFPSLQSAFATYFGLGAPMAACCQVGGPLQDAWAYVLLDLASIAWLLRTRRRTDTAVALLGVGVLLYAATLSVGAPGVIVHYMYPVVAVALPLGVLAAVDVAGRLRRGPVVATVRDAAS